MRYLFFDLECADGRMAICEFGYVLTDDKFRILGERNLLINPERRFHLSGREGQVDITLTYDEEEYYRYYPFDDTDVYGFIRKLMTQKDLLILGHSVNSDIGYLFKDCERYGLELFDFRACDVQRMLPVFDKHNKRYTSLEKAYMDLVAKETRNKLKDHRAHDDALKTMLVFKAMVEDLEFTPEELIASCPGAVYNALEYWKEHKEKKKKISKTHNASSSKKQGQIMWGDLYREHLPHLEEESSRGKLITVSGEMKEHIEELRHLIQYIKEKGYVAYDRINGSDFLLVYNEENKKEMTNHFKHPYHGQILTFLEFMKRE